MHLSLLKASEEPSQKNRKWLLQETASQLLEEIAVNRCCWNELKLGVDRLAKIS